MNKLYYNVVLEKQFPLPSEREELVADTEASGNGKDVISIVSELMREKEACHELIVKMQYRHDEVTNDELEQMIRSILPFLDGLERLLKMARLRPPSVELTNWIKSIESLYFRIMNVLEKQGLTPIEAIGKQVDLNYHEVVEYIPSKDSPHNTVIAERQRGYIFRNKVIRDAKVVVSYREGSV